MKCVEALDGALPAQLRLPNPEPGELWLICPELSLILPEIGDFIRGHCTASKARFQSPG